MTRELEERRQRAAAMERGTFGCASVAMLPARIALCRMSPVAELEESRKRTAEMEQELKAARVEAAELAAHVKTLRTSEAALVSRVSELDAAVGAQTDRSAALSQQAASLFKELARAKR